MASEKTVKGPTGNSILKDQQDKAAKEAEELAKAQDSLESEDDQGGPSANSPANPPANPAARTANVPNEILEREKRKMQEEHKAKSLNIYGGHEKRSISELLSSGKDEESSGQFVTVKWKGQNFDRPKDLDEMSFRSISIPLKGRSPLRILTEEEEERWMPGLIGMVPTDPGFRKAVHNFYAELNLQVPYAGEKLNIGLNAKGNPLNLEHYVKYRMCKVNPTVASSKEEADELTMAMFFIEDLQANRNRARLKAQMVTEAQALLLSIIGGDDSEIKMAAILERVYEDRIDHLSPDDYTMELQNVIASDPKKFISAASDPNLLIAGLIQRMIKHKVIVLNGDSYFDMRERNVGRSFESVVAFFKDPSNREHTETLKAQLREKMKAS
jgi:hypothetical protein